MPSRLPRPFPAHSISTSILTDMSLSKLRKQALERAGNQCEWPQCGYTQGLQLAHLTHRGMGGSPKANVLANVCILCEYHHDILDGRTIKGRRRAIQNLLTRYLNGKWLTEKDQTPDAGGVINE